MRSQLNIDSNCQYKSSTRHTQRDILTRLPNELSARVWKELDDPADRMMLALTCKSNAHMFESLKSVKAQSAVRRKITLIRTKNTQRTKQQVQKGTETQVITLLRRLQPWMKPTQDLCYICGRYRLRAATVAVRNFTEKGGWGGKAFPAIDAVDGKKTSLKVLQTEGRRCPECVLKKHIEYQKHSSDFKKSMRILARTGAFDRLAEL